MTKLTDTWLSLFHLVLPVKALLSLASPRHRLCLFLRQKLCRYSHYVRPQLQASPHKLFYEQV